jgi:SAM-dependent methyltransferase
MSRFAAEYLSRWRRSDILDIGAYDVNGTYREIFNKRRWSYTGADIEAGPNVDLMLADPYDWQLGREWDVVVSGQTLEHVAKPWLWIQELAAALRPGGICCVIAPHTYHFHEHPIDAWRVWPEGMRGLFEHAGLVTGELRVNDTDTVGIATR